MRSLSKETTMTTLLYRARLRAYTGPTIVNEVAAALTAYAGPNERVVVEGTAHIHIELTGTGKAAILRLAEGWAARAGHSWLRERHLEILRFDYLGRA
jgi:hypothetical protein